MLTKDFINNVLKQEIYEMTMQNNNATHPYIGFSLICQSIEILGACFDGYDWENKNLSELRFRLAISKLFSEKYQKFNNRENKYDLYSNLRCPMIHQMRPGKYIGLSERKHEKKANKEGIHLEIQNDKLILIYEDFLLDFQRACESLVNLIDEKKLNANKVLNNFISAPNN